MSLTATARSLPGTLRTDIVVDGPSGLVALLGELADAISGPG